MKDIVGFRILVLVFWGEFRVVETFDARTARMKDYTTVSLGMGGIGADFLAYFANLGAYTEQ